MIREAAARSLAQAILGAYVKRGFATEEQVEDAAALIQLGVRVDESQQELEAMNKEAA